MLIQSSFAPRKNVNVFPWMLEKQTKTSNITVMSWTLNNSSPLILQTQQINTDISRLDLRDMFQHIRYKILVITIFLECIFSYLMKK